MLGGPGAFLTLTSGLGVVDLTRYPCADPGIFVRGGPGQSDKKSSDNVYLFFYFFTCVALAKAGLVVGGLRPSVRLSVRPFVCPSVSLSATLMGCLVCVICNSNSFHSFIFKLCLMIVHTLKMCTSYFVHI